MGEKESGSFAIIMGAVIIFGFSLINGSLSSFPANLVRSGLFMENMISIPSMNDLLMALLMIGVVSFILSLRMPLTVKSNSNWDWNKLPASSRMGMLCLFGLLGVFLIIYLGHGAVRDLVNSSVVFLKNADVEGFRDYLLSFGPLAAIISALLMIFQSVMAPLPAFVITFANGLLFGWFYGALLSGVQP